ncbi:hypothetical protein BV25DRAFT_1842759 [Artomyces pyxidatus]|uniref:Uncharacterized protein n=1 Tax=Artomyces pyxidatus TaxID=48021 RepID=A0ACB8SIQ6_9AGAM|nr:hypothetical protein BV25DRAFT_1842759 [Artomyces pyxidatus]
MAYQCFPASSPSDSFPFDATVFDSPFNSVCSPDTEHHPGYSAHLRDENNRPAPAGDYYSTFETAAPSNARLYAPTPHVGQGTRLPVTAFPGGLSTLHQAQFNRPVEPPAEQSPLHGAPLDHPTSPQSVTEFPAPDMLFQHTPPALPATDYQPVDDDSVPRIVALLGTKAARGLFRPDPRPASIACSWPGCAQGVAPDAGAFYEHFVAAHCGQQSPVDCTCGRTLKLGSLRTHLKTARHLGPWLAGRCALCGAAVARDDAMGVHLAACAVMRDPARRAGRLARLGLRVPRLGGAGAVA